MEKKHTSKNISFVIKYEKFHVCILRTRPHVYTHLHTHKTDLTKFKLSISSIFRACGSARV